MMYHIYILIWYTYSTSSQNLADINQKSIQDGYHDVYETDKDTA